MHSPASKGHCPAESILFLQGGITYSFSTIKRKERARSRCLCQSHGSSRLTPPPCSVTAQPGIGAFPPAQLVLGPPLTPWETRETRKDAPDHDSMPPAVGPRTPGLLGHCVGASGWTERAAPLGGEATEMSAPLRASVSPPVTWGSRPGPTGSTPRLRSSHPDSRVRPQRQALRGAVCSGAVCPGT